MEIDIDFEVFKALTARRTHESITYNDVLRELLELKKPSHSPSTPQKGLMTKGVFLPDGTKLRAFYKGKQYTAEVINGAIVLLGERHQSFSSAAYAVTHSAVNGWRFWECLVPGSEDWKLADMLRVYAR